MGGEPFEQEYERRVRALWNDIRRITNELMALAADDRDNGFGALVDATQADALVGTSSLKREDAIRIRGLNASFGTWFQTPDAPLLGGLTPENAIRKRF